MQLVSCGNDGTVRLWDIAGGTVVKQFALAEEGAKMGPLYTVAFSPDAQLVAAAGADRLIHIWNVANGQLTRTVEGHTDEIYRVQFNAQSTRIMSVGHSGALSIWNVADGQQAMTSTLANVAYFATYSADGTKVIATCSDGKAYVVDISEDAR